MIAPQAVLPQLLGNATLSNMQVRPSFAQDCLLQMAWCRIWSCGGNVKVLTYTDFQHTHAPAQSVPVYVEQSLPVYQAQGVAGGQVQPFLAAGRHGRRRLLQLQVPPG